ncbi:NUDIX hydrolase domain-like protein [Xylaria arbuscula]|nr:NUDIX hydrolase domain-like protein [Xylaria arbuscula]
MASKPPEPPTIPSSSTPPISTSTSTSTFTFTSVPSVAAFDVTLDKYLSSPAAASQGIQLQGLCVGAFVFNASGHLLLVQRAPTDSYPLRWEVPGGAIDGPDASLLHGVARELYEETGLRARHIGGLVGEGYTFLTRRPSVVCKFSFLVEVESYDVQLDPEEHVAFLWVSEDEARSRKCGGIEMEYTTKQQADIILEAFEVKKTKEAEAVDAAE